MFEVSSISKRTAVSTKPVQPGKFYHLSVLDRVMEHNVIHVVFYYRTFDKKVKLDESMSETLIKLDKSMSETLNAFTNITGRLLRSPEDQWLIKCNDAGLRLIEAKVKGSVDEWLKHMDREKELSLAHWEPMLPDPYYWSPFYVQITEFEEGGVAIGLSCTHLLADPTTVTMFIKAWADMSFAGKMLSPPHFHPLPPRTALNITPHHDRVYTHGHLINHYKPTTAQNQPSLISPPAKQTTITLLFPDEIVRDCMLMAQTTVAEALERNCARGAFEALAALFWTRVSKVKNVGVMDLVIGLDVRNVLGLDKGFFGNCMVYNKVPWKKENMISEDDSLRQATNAIRKVVNEMDKEAIVDLIEWLEQNNCHASNVLDVCDSLVCVNLEDLDSYSACFGEHFEPVHVSYYIEPDVGPGANSIFILPSPPGTGLLSRTIMVTLPENEVVKLMKDPLIQQFSPSVKMRV